MAETIIYQTIEYRDNQSPDEIEETGPFPCKNKNAWLGHGFYFWDSHIQLAHEWGYHGYSSNYIICESKVTLDERCFDLVGNGEHQIQFNLIFRKIKTDKKYQKNPTVSQVIEHLKQLNIFHFEAIRANGYNSFPSLDTKGLPRDAFFHPSQKGKATMRLIPENQICLTKWSALNREEYNIIFPEDLAEDYLGVF